MTKTKHPLIVAMATANEARHALLPGCLRVAVAGSVRRGNPYVGDVEIVAIPNMERNTAWQFGDDPATYTVFGATLHALVRGGVFVPGGKDGPKYKRFEVQGIALDLWMCDADNWGNILAIRTGDWEFSRLLVTLESYGGLMRDDLLQRGGYLWRIREDGDTEDDRTLLPCPEEADFFRHLGVEHVPVPSQRTAETICELRNAKLRLSTKGAT